MFKLRTRTQLPCVLITAHYFLLMVLYTKTKNGVYSQVQKELNPGDPGCLPAKMTKLYKQMSYVFPMSTLLMQLTQGDTAQST